MAGGKSDSRTHQILAVMQRRLNSLSAGQDDLRSPVAALQSSRSPNAISAHASPQVPPVYNGTGSLLKLKPFNGKQPLDLNLRQDDVFAASIG